MNLTQEQKKRLAREMRKLAMECVNNGPEMGDNWCGCAIGLSLARAGLGRQPTEDIGDYCVRASVLDELPGMPYMALSDATRERIWRGNPTAVVFPLLALADAIEESEAARSAPEESSRSLP